MVNLDASPATSMAPSAIIPTRNLGPCMSASSAVCVPSLRSNSRTRAAVVAWVSWSPWEKLRRMTFTPSRISASSTSEELLAGPTVAMILVNFVAWWNLFVSACSFVIQYLLLRDGRRIHRETGRHPSHGPQALQQCI